MSLNKTNRSKNIITRADSGFTVIKLIENDHHGHLSFEDLRTYAKSKPTSPISSFHMIPDFTEAVQTTDQVVNPRTRNQQRILRQASNKIRLATPAKM